SYLGPNYPNGNSAYPTDYVDEADHPADDYNRLFQSSAYQEYAYGYYWPDPQTGDKYLQYWFFYYYNPKTFFDVGNHEGDWESIQVHLSPKNIPLKASYSQHSGGETCGWGTVQLTTDDRPIVYPAQGSHSNY